MLSMAQYLLKHKHQIIIMSEKIEVTESRKGDHIALAFDAQVKQVDPRFYYEPLLSAHPKTLPNTHFLGKILRTPMWVSSMTGGAERAGRINKNLAKICQEFGFGMGLGSCRIILEDDTFFDDFNLRPILGHEVPFFANLGIAQIEELLESGKTDLMKKMVDKLQADGLIIHVNPLQEWIQPEGDRFQFSPLETIEKVLELVNFPVIVKEVGQGMGKESLRALFQLPLAAVDFAAHGGTNFAQIEMLRSSTFMREMQQPLAFVGHSAEEMVGFTNEVLQELGNQVRCNQVIISGGVKNFLDGYYLTQKINTNAIYGQAAPFLKYALEGEEELRAFVQSQVEGLKIAHAVLRVR